jgi:hypothetical protein
VAEGAFVISRKNNLQKKNYNHIYTNCEDFTKKCIFSIYASLTTNNSSLVEQQNMNVFRRVRNISKSDYQLHHVCPSAWNNSAPTGQILKKSDI